MTDQERAVMQQALEALKYLHEEKCDYMRRNNLGDPLREDAARLALPAITALRAALAQQEEPVWMHPWPPVRAQQAEPQTIDEALQQPRAMAQAYENGYKAGVAAEREECAKLCEARFMGDMTREDMEARRCAAAIRARGNT